MIDDFIKESEMTVTLQQGAAKEGFAGLMMKDVAATENKFLSLL